MLTSCYLPRTWLQSSGPLLRMCQSQLIMSQCIILLPAANTGGSCVRSSRPMYTRNDGCASVTPMMEAGYPKAIWPRETIQQMKKFHPFQCLSVPKAMVGNAILEEQVTAARVACFRGACVFKDCKGEGAQGISYISITSSASKRPRPKY